MFLSRWAILLLLLLSSLSHSLTILLLLYNSNSNNIYNSTNTHSTMEWYVLLRLERHLEPETILWLVGNTIGCKTTGGLVSGEVLRCDWTWWYTSAASLRQLLAQSIVLGLSWSHLAFMAIQYQYPYHSYDYYYHSSEYHSHLSWWWRRGRHQGTRHFLSIIFSSRNRVPSTLLRLDWKSIATLPLEWLV